jgi:16S rRNA (uracil1498-N3)-methyltransferase
MKIHRFYWVENPEIIDNKELINQLLNVFRMKVGSQFYLFNDSGKEFLVEMVNFTKKEIVCKIVKEKEMLKREKSFILVFSLIKKENTELVLQKCTEIGVTHFVPVITERTIKTGWNFERNQKIIIEAVEQSGFGDIPRLEQEPMRLESFLKEQLPRLASTSLQQSTPSKEGELKVGNIDNIYVLDMGENNIGSILKGMHYSPPFQGWVRGGELCILVGPEGGWTEGEREMFRKNDIRTISLGENVLRAETACISISALLLL